MGNLDRPRYGITKLLLIVGVLLLATLGFAGAALADGPSISSDKADYMPGETLTSPTTPSPITLSTFPLTANVSFGYSTSTTGSTTGVASVATSPVTNSSTVSLTSGVSQSATIPVTLPATLLNGTYNATATV